jgi:hypothetical protein
MGRWKYTRPAAKGAHFVLLPFAHFSVAAKKHFDVPKIPNEKPLF